MLLTIEKAGAFPIARMSGEWRATDDEPYEGELHSLVDQAGAKLAVDLSGLQLIDSAGLAVLISVVTHARLSHATAVLVGPSPFVAGVFEVTRLDQWFDICGDLEEAARFLGVG